MFYYTQAWGSAHFTSNIIIISFVVIKLKVKTIWCFYRIEDQLLPIMDAAERLFTGDVVHEDEAHGAAVVGRGDGSVPLLARSVLRQRENESWIFWTLAELLISWFVERRVFMIIDYMEQREHTARERLWERQNSILSILWISGEGQSRSSL